MEEFKGDKRSKAYKQWKKNHEAKSEGLGHTVEKVFEKVGIKKAVKFLAGEDCGCEQRAKILNDLFPYQKPLCLMEDEYNYLTERIGKINKISSEEQKELRANGGRIGFNEGGLDPKIREIVIDLMDNEGFEFGEAVKEAYKRVEKTKPGKANGGRIGFSNGTLGGDTKYNSMVTKMYIEAGGQEGTGMDIVSFADQYFPKKAEGGRIGYAYGSDEIVDQASGIMGLPQRTNSEGIKELDLRDSGGFIPPVGVKEKADDVPAMLSKNEFVMTADAVRAAGGGSVNQGAKRMYELMNNLEARA